MEIQGDQYIWYREKKEHHRVKCGLSQLTTLQQPSVGRMISITLMTANMTNDRQQIWIFWPLENSPSFALCYYRADLPRVLCSGSIVIYNLLITVRFPSKTAETTETISVAVRGFRLAFQVK